MMSRLRKEVSATARLRDDTKRNPMPELKGGHAAKKRVRTLLRGNFCSCGKGLADDGSVQPRADGSAAR